MEPSEHWEHPYCSHYTRTNIPMLASPVRMPREWDEERDAENRGKKMKVSDVNCLDTVMVEDAC